MKDPCVSRNRIALAIIAIAFGAGLMTMAGISMFHSYRMDAVRIAHRDEMAAQERRFTRERRKMHRDLVERLEKMECAK